MSAGRALAKAMMILGFLCCAVGVGLGGATGFGSQRTYWGNAYGGVALSVAGAGLLISGALLLAAWLGVAKK